MPLRGAQAPLYLRHALPGLHDKFVLWAGFGCSLPKGRVGHLQLTQFFRLLTSAIWCLAKVCAISGLLPWQ